MAYYNSTSEYTVNLSESINEVNGSDTILIFSSRTLAKLAGDLMFSLANLNKIYERLKGGKDVAEIKKSDDDIFRFLHTMAGGLGFSYIIPVRNNKPLGYIAYKTTQGRSRDINIKLAFEVENSSLGFDNGIALGENKTSTTNFNPDLIIGSENWQYSSGLNENGGASKYSRHVKNSINSPAVITNAGVYDGKIETKLSLNQNFTINPHRVEGLEDNLRFSYFAGDLAVYGWTGNKYTIYSLTKHNRFGLPVSYTPSDTGYYTHTADIINWAGNVPNGTGIVDEWDPESKSIVWKDFERIFGDWKNNGEYWKNWYGNVTLKRRVIPINNRVLLEKTETNYVLYYDGKKVEEFSSSNKIEDTYLTRFRRSFLPVETEIPEILGAVSGIIYYRGKNGNIWYL